MKILHNNTSLLLVAVLLSITISGCYTLLKHPETSEDIQTADFNDCSKCHTGHPYVGPYDPVYTGLWRDYYSVPWWHHGVFATDEEDFQENPIVHEREIDNREIREGTGDFKSGRTAPPSVLLHFHRISRWIIHFKERRFYYGHTERADGRRP